jgi:hypothetical protein
MESFGCGIFDSKRMEEKMKEAIRKREPAFERGISPGEEGKFSSASSSAGRESVL